MNSKNIMERCVGLLVLAVMGAFFSSTASAQLLGISVNFQGSGSAMATGDVAGVVPLPNWNNIYTTMQWTNITSPNLVDSSGNSTTTKFTINYGYSSAGGGQANYGNGTTGDVEMLGGSMVYTNSAMISLSNISYSLYDLYIYVGPGETGKTGTKYNGSVTVDGTTVYYQNLINSAYVQATDTTGPASVAAQANYIKFSNLTDASLSIMLKTYDYTNTGIYGFQIVAVPEPSTYMTLTVGGLLLALLCVRRGKKA
jgi:hypothetical protein